MRNTMPLLLCDFYKVCHSSQYPKDITKVVSYFTPRMSRIAGQDKLIMFGLQGFIKDYLIDYFNENFFHQREETILQYSRILKHTLGYVPDEQRIVDLYNLGYLPISIRAIPEGERVDIKVPMFEISNTHPKFAWLTNALETLISCSLWHPMVSANVGYMYRQIVDEYYAKTVDSLPNRRALGDFSMRGQESLESAIKSSAGWLLSFVNTATVPAIPWLEKNYNCNCEKEEVGFGTISTEHSVMCSNFAVDGDEITMIKRLLTEIYPNQSFSMVSDSYDYWNLIDYILPQCKQEILNHEGFIGIRGDSGDCVEVVTQTVFKLWDIFGGGINSKGYKVLCSKVKAIYGDAITIQRCRKIYEILEENGFACNNVSLGVGSFSMQCLQEDDAFDERILAEIREDLEYKLFEKQFIDRVIDKLRKNSLSPFTRDTFGIAIKATYAEDKDGNPIMIYKDPKTDTGNFKRSQKGCCLVHKNSEGNFFYYDGYIYEQTLEKTAMSVNQLVEVFRDGKMVKEHSLQEIRARLHKGEF